MYKPQNFINRRPNIDDYRNDDDFPHQYVMDLAIWEQENEEVPSDDEEHFEEEYWGEEFFD